MLRPLVAPRGALGPHTPQAGRFASQFQMARRGSPQGPVSASRSRLAVACLGRPSPHQARPESAARRSPTPVGSRWAVKAASGGQAAPAAWGLGQAPPSRAPSLPACRMGELGMRSGRGCLGYLPPSSAGPEGHPGSTLPVRGPLALCLGGWAPGSHLPLCPLLFASGPLALALCLLRWGSVGALTLKSASPRPLSLKPSELAHH